MFSFVLLYYFGYFLVEFGDGRVCSILILILSLVALFSLFLISFLMGRLAARVRCAPLQFRHFNWSQLWHSLNEWPISAHSEQTTVPLSDGCLMVVLVARPTGSYGVKLLLLDLTIADVIGRRTYTNQKRLLSSP